MSKGGKVAQEAIELCRPIIETCGVELVDVDYVREGGDMVLRFYIDKENGVGLDDCASVSEAINDLLDAELSVQTPYLLEVSSPGLTRPLSTVRDLKRHLGELLDIKFFAAFDGHKEIVAKLLAVDGDSLSIEYEPPTKSKKPKRPVKPGKEPELRSAVVELSACAKITRHITF